MLNPSKYSIGIDISNLSEDRKEQLRNLIRFYSKFEINAKIDVTINDGILSISKRKLTIEFSKWALSVKHTIAIDTALLLQPFSYISIHLLHANLCTAFNFPFKDVNRTM